MIRPVQTADVPAVVALVRDTLTEFDIAFGAGTPTDEQVLQLPDSYAAHGGQFFVAVEGDALIGTAGVFPVEPGVFELRKMFLRPAARGKGAAQQLLDACLDFVKAHGGRRVVLDTTSQMTAAIRFYERNGFVRDDTQRRASRCNRGYRLEL